MNGETIFGAKGGSGGYLEYIFKYAAKALYNVDVAEMKYTVGRNPDFKEVQLEVCEGGEGRGRGWREKRRGKGGEGEGEMVARVMRAHHKFLIISLFFPLLFLLLFFFLSIQVEGNKVLHFAQMYSFKNINTLMRKIKDKKCPYDFVEVMACPSGTYSSLSLSLSLLSPFLFSHQLLSLFSYPRSPLPIQDV